MSLISTLRRNMARVFPSTLAHSPGSLTPSAQYMRGGRGVTLAGWRPALRDEQEDISQAWDGAAARVADLIHNNGWLSGAVDQAVANTVGCGLRLKAIPENETFAMDARGASDWSKTVERRFELWARTAQECDIQGQRTFGQMQAAAFRSWLVTGEILAELTWRKRPWTRYGTKVRLVPPQRLSRRTDPAARLINGVYTDADGMAVAYRATRRLRSGPGAVGLKAGTKGSLQSGPPYGEDDYRVRARDSAGRPRVIHVFQGLPGTYRGISPMVPALQVARQFDQLADATLMASIVQALFAVTITSDQPSEEALGGLLTHGERAAMEAQGTPPVEAYLDAAAGYYQNTALNVGINGRLTHMFPGQQLQFHSSQQPSSHYTDFSMQLLRELARCLGLTYESTTGDTHKATYSSLQAATTEIFAITQARRQAIVAPFCQPIYEAWLEEEIASGGLSFPGGYDGFMAHRTGACRAQWRGTPRPTADDLKKAKAHETWYRMGVMSHAAICNDLGLDVDDVYQELSQERALRAEYRLADPVAMGAAGGGLHGLGHGDPEDKEVDGDEDDEDEVEVEDEEEDDT